MQGRLPAISYFLLIPDGWLCDPGRIDDSDLSGAGDGAPVSAPEDLLAGRGIRPEDAAQFISKNARSSPDLPVQ